MDPSTDEKTTRIAEAEGLRALLARYRLRLCMLDPDAEIPGSFWGAPEAGLVGTTVYARSDTPVHSVLHEACHAICMTPARRASLHTDAGGGYDEENCVCYLQIVLADQLHRFDRGRMMRDMDEWGYTFRLGSARAWFERDAAESRRALVFWGILDAAGQPTWQMRGQTAGAVGRERRSA